MNSSSHPLSELFAQLGLPCAELEIQTFLQTHAPLSPDILLPNAPFWSPEQADFLREALLQDADWAPVVDQLNVALRGPVPVVI